MCGIAGLINSQSSGNVKIVEAMLSAMTHRGPDQDGLWSASTNGRELLLGHRRLSIIDLSEAGRQPMVHPQDNVVLSYNGECYNFVELRSELMECGHEFVSSSDTEVLLAAYVEWGELAISKLRGMFALAIWDPKVQALILARDRLGIKPLYFQERSGRFAFASELRAILLASEDVPRLDPVSLNAYLWHGFVPGPRTMVRGIQLLDAGCTLRVGVDGYCESSKKYWQIPMPKTRPDLVEAKIDAVKELESAVELRLVSDVPLGVFLSGGVDSSVLAGLAQKVSDQSIRTFNIRFDEEGYDESGYARRVADSLDTDHSEILIDERAFNVGLSDALDSLDQPTFDGINTFFVSKAVRDAGLTVALSGAGGDELFGGYSSFIDIPRAKKLSRLSNILPSSLTSAVGQLGARILSGAGSEIRPQTRFGKLEDLLDTRGDVLKLYQVSYSLFSREFLATLLLEAEPVLPWGLEKKRFADLQEQTRHADVLAAISHMELASFIGERLLRDTDTASMAASLEVRVPMLDHIFVEKLAALDSATRYEPVRGKQFLKDLIAADLPADIFDRPKAGFEIPLELWCRRSLKDEMEGCFSDLVTINAMGLNCETVSRVWRAFKKGGAGVYWSRVWALYVLIRWCKLHGVYL
ncbi:MAG: asparagine synthase (glutamine-hydrolyzing) [Pseudomonadaceae bacterium]|nr:asparagine synthase (glutamine-hydrolyzing) [Pseudomonadaceae bacterium]